MAAAYRCVREADDAGGAYEIMEIIGKDESLRRIRKGIELLNGAQ